MSFRLNPFKVMRAVGIVAIIAYGVVLATGYKKSKVTTTESITKEMKIRNKDFYNSKDYKNNLTLPNQVIENNNETAVKELEQAKSAQPVNLQQNTETTSQTPETSNQSASQQPKMNVKATDDAKKKQSQAKQEAKKLEQKKQEEARLAEQKRQEEARAEARQAEIRKQHQEAAKKEQAKAEAAKQHAKEEAAKRAKEEAARKAREDAKKNQAKGGSKKYIQVASVISESSAREIAKKLGGNFYYKKTSVNGRSVYVVMSNMTDNPNTLKTMENQAKKAGSGYMIRSVGK